MSRPALAVLTIGVMLSACLHTVESVERHRYRTFVERVRVDALAPAIGATVPPPTPGRLWIERSATDLVRTDRAVGDDTNHAAIGVGITAGISAALLTALVIGLSSCNGCLGPR